MHRRFLLLASAGLALPLPALGQEKTASTQLYKNSVFITLPRFSVEVIGKGPDLVLTPGLSSSRETWRVTADRLKSRYRIHLIQIAGFAGESSRANDGASEVLVSTAEDIDAYIAGLKKPVLFAGHSLGGTTVLYLAQKHPEHYRKVLLIDALSFFGLAYGMTTVDQIRPMAARVAKGAGRGAQAEATAKAMIAGEKNQAMLLGWMAASDGKVLGRAMADDLLLDLRPGLKTMTTPLTIITPDNLGMGIPPGQYAMYYRTAYADLASKTLVEIKGSNHFVMFDQPAAFAQAFDA
jgi:pimeloyl-[acyl-carrier protein] methyl ester esterase